MSDCRAVADPTSKIKKKRIQSVQTKSSAADAELNQQQLPLGAEWSGFGAVP
jgi:hypothetical protein